MTVSELIEELKEAPQDVPVRFANFKDVGDVLWDMWHGKIVAVVLQ